MDSYEQVRYSLEKDPEAATSIFLDHDWEPPLCAAVRLGCDGEIVQLLLDHGADVNATDMKGRTPITILSSCRTRCNDTDTEICELLGNLPFGSARQLSSCLQHVRDCAKKHDLRVAEVLATAGADPRLPDDRGSYPCDLARTCGNTHLVQFWGLVD
jgi:ankyrin repeat protein